MCYVDRVTSPHHAKILRAPYTTLMLTPATMAICAFRLKILLSARKKKRGKKGRKKPAITNRRSVE